MIETVIPLPAAPLVPVVGLERMFPVHRIYCVGRNYAEHAKEMGHSDREPPFFFMKPADAIVVAAGDKPTPVPYPPQTRNYHHEVELVVAIGQGGSNIAVQDALQHVYGYAVGLDMTRRDLQSEMKAQGRPWCIAKGFDASAPIAAIAPAAQAGNIHQASITLHVNGQLRQRGNTAELIWSVAETIAALSQAWTLQAGDLIYTGTPAGVGAVVAGDVLLAEVQGLPPLHARIV